MSIASVAAAAGPRPAQRLDSAPVMELVLMRVRLRARRRGAWLAHLQAGAGEHPHCRPDASLAAAFDGRDAPDAEAAWYRRAPVAQPLNEELEGVERTLAADPGARLRELQRMFRLSEPELDLLQTSLARISQTRRCIGALDW